MTEQLNIADAMTITGGVVTCVGAFNLDKPWGSVAVGVGKLFDGFDGHLARRLGVDNETGGATLDTTIDRFTEGAIVTQLVAEKVIPTSLPIVGYGLRSVSKSVGEEKSRLGTSTMYLKDLAIATGVLATSFNKDSKTHQRLKRTANTLGWCAVALGLIDVTCRN